MDEQIQSEVTYTFEDFERHYFYMRNRNIWLKYIILLPLILFIPIFLFLYLLDSNKFFTEFSKPEKYSVFIIAYLIVGIIWFLKRNKMSYFQRNSLKKQIDSSPALSVPQIISFDEEGFHGENQFGSGHIYWNVMVEATETEEDFYFFRTPKFAQFVPKRFFTNEQLVQIRELAKINLGDKANF